MQRWTGVLLIALLAVGSAGCATRGQVADLERRVSALQDGVDRAQKEAESASERAAAAERQAAQAASAAQGAQTEAAQAAKAADAAARKSEAIFNKTVRK